MTVKIVPVQSDDLPALFALLEDSGLPTAGLAAHLATTLVACDGERLVGSAALELYRERIPYCARVPWLLRCAGRG